MSAVPDDADIAMTVGEVSTLLGVSVRALHHWDESGLVHPSRRSAAGYRLYSEADIMRIQQVLVYRQTGMSLADIKAVLDEPGADALTHLRRQRELVQGQISHLQHKLSSIDMVIDIQQLGARISVAEMAEIWGTDWGESLSVVVVPARFLAEKRVREASYDPASRSRFTRRYSYDAPSPVCCVHADPGSPD